MKDLETPLEIDTDAGPRCPTEWPDQHGLSGTKHEAYAALLRSHAVVMARIENLAQREGALPLEWYDVLLALEYAPGHRLRVGDLYCHVVLSRSGLTRLVDRLEAAGLVDRKINSQDRRSFEVILKPAGKAAREKTWPTYARIISEVFGTHYTEEEAAQLAALLSRQFENKGGGCDGGGCNGPQSCDGESEGNSD